MVKQIRYDTSIIFIFITHIMSRRSIAIGFIDFYSAIIQVRDKKNTLYYIS